MNTFEKLLEDNKAWAAEQVKVDPDFFTRLEKIQSPEFLWIGCSDSRVPANEITGTKPGEIFVHRNIANLVVTGDTSMLSVLQYSVEVLKVKHVIVCGHYGCGGVNAAMTNKSLGGLNNWLRNIKDVYQLHRQELELLPEEKRSDRLVELSVQEQVNNLARNYIIQRAWKSEQRPSLHGWVYSLGNGILKPVVRLQPNSPVDPIYQFEI